MSALLTRSPASWSPKPDWPKILCGAAVGVYDHFYDTNRYNVPAYGKHYLVHGFGLILGRHPDIMLDAQHGELRRMTVGELLAAPDVHENTKVYMRL